MSRWLFKIAKTDGYFTMNIAVKIPERSLMTILNTIAILGGAGVIEIVRKL